MTVAPRISAKTTRGAAVRTTEQTYLPPTAEHVDVGTVPFRWEADMTEVVERGVGDLVAPSARDLELVRELPSAIGIIDLVAVEFDASALEHRVRAGLGPLTLPLRIRVLDLLRTDRPMRAETLALRLGTTPAAVQRSTLGPLEECGAVELVGGRVRATGAWRPVAKQMTAVELKLSKWRDALMQADNAAHSADRAWVVLDRARAAAAVAAEDHFRAFGIGLALVDRTGALEVVVRPRRRATVRWSRSLLGELAWARVCAAVGTSDEAAPAVQELGLRAAAKDERQAVPEGDAVIEALADRDAALVHRERAEGRALLVRHANLVASGLVDVVGAAHRLAAVAQARLVARLRR